MCLIAHRARPSSTLPRVASTSPSAFLPRCLPLLKEGRIRALAVTTEKRAARHSGCADHGGSRPARVSKRRSGSRWWRRRALPPALLARLNREINAILTEPEMKRVLSAQAITVELKTPEALRETIRVDIEKWRAIAAEGGRQGGVNTDIGCCVRSFSAHPEEAAATRPAARTSVRAAVRRMDGSFARTPALAGPHHEADRASP